MATVLGIDSSIYWGSAAIAPTRVKETRNVAIDMGADYAEDTVHGDVNKTFTPTFSNFAASVTGLYDTLGGGDAKRVIDDALNKRSGTFSIYIGNISNYFRGSGYVSVDDVSAPYDDFSGFNWSIRPLGAVSHYAVT